MYKNIHFVNFMYICGLYADFQRIYDRPSPKWLRIDQDSALRSVRVTLISIVRSALEKGSQAPFGTELESMEVWLNCLMKKHLFIYLSCKKNSPENSLFLIF